VRARLVGRRPASGTHSKKSPNSAHSSLRPSSSLLTINPIHPDTAPPSTHTTQTASLNPIFVEKVPRWHSLRCKSPTARSTPAVLLSVLAANEQFQDSTKITHVQNEPTRLQLNSFDIFDFEPPSPAGSLCCAISHLYSRPESHSSTSFPFHLDHRLPS
jgi:hypothetical protein